MSSPSLPVLPSPGQIKNYQPEDVPNDNIPQESTSVTDEVEQQAVPFITCETMEKPSSPAMFEDAEKVEFYYMYKEKCPIEVFCILFVFQ